MTLEANPVADLFPMLPDDELAELAADIKERGQLQPIVLDTEGRILDGRNRYAACRMAGVEPRFETYSGDDPDGYAAAANLGRRDMTKGQKAVVIAQYREYKNYTRDDSDAFGVSKQYISWARGVLKFTPELVDGVLRGTLPLSNAYEEASERKKTAAELESKRRRLATSAPDLLGLVSEERMTIDDAIAALNAREEKERQDAEAQEKAEMIARQESLNGYSDAVDNLTRVLSWAKTYPPPAELPDGYLPLTHFARRTESLLNIISQWETE